MDFEREQEIIRRFIDKKRRSRLLLFLDPAKDQRQKFFDQLRDTRYFDQSRFFPIEQRDEKQMFLYLQAMKFKGEMYLMRRDHEANEKNSVFGANFLTEFLKQEEAIAYCISIKKGIFKNHEDDIYLLA